MTYIFDTLDYAELLTAAGLACEHAEAHADSAGDFILGELVTKTDLRDVKARLTIRFGAMIAAAVAILAAAVKLL